MSTPPILRLYLLFATENDSAVILRRSAKKMYNLIAWDRATDTFTEGQWLKKSVYAEECQLSPDGRHLIYTVAEAYPHTPATSYYTVLSRSPYFTALALFPHGYGWQSGGYFLDSTLYRINGDPVDDILGRDCDLSRVVKGEVTKDCRSGLRLLNGHRAPLSRALRDQLLEGAKPPRGTAMDRYETQAGCLYRLEAGKRVLIRDFTEMEPRFEPAPYSTDAEADDQSNWHPLDQERRR
ncbi:hypothetical protein SLH49_18980 [Cognatiyoonia sp. IB215446]|uniref:hypothetical protein n=1 Tax=Cognatiyoonia sp. IB215446 TaxID=3097355 RepID=UPI002A111498|nr:hypothetical protein [Cognatiyoonia sp. IB215446]MDX8350080.1 hypothetical protein [Cognatiyoonia sp. IB215446]